MTSGVAMTDAATAQKSGWDEFQFDHFSTKLAVRPWDVWRRLRDECPVIHSDRYGGFWFVSRYDDVQRVLVDTDAFTATKGINTPRILPLLPGEADPPQHRQYRAIINPAFAPQRVAEHEEWIREVARERIAAIADRERFDVVADFTAPYAKRVAMRWIGFPADDLDKLDHWTHQLAVGVRDDEEAARIGTELVTYLISILEARPSQPEGDDVIWAVATGEIDGRPLSMQEQQDLMMEITFGGLHTTSGVLGGALVWLADHPEDRARLRDDPDLMPTAIEEFVRYLTPVAQMTRHAAKDVELSGCPIKAGDRVQFGMGSANFDERQFERPDEVILDRYPNRHLGFGGGPHRCVGSHLGKLGVRVGLEEFLAAFRTFEVVDHHGLRWGGGEGRHLMNAPFVVTGR
jgi:cytochrome P450